MSGCGGEPLQFDKIGEKRFDEFLGSLYTDSARARSIRLLSRYIWGDSKLPDKYERIADGIDGLGWIDGSLYRINCPKEEEPDTSDRYENIGKNGLTENARLYFTDQLNNEKVNQSDRDIGLLAVKAILDGETNLGIDAFICLGISKLKVNKWDYLQTTYDFPELPDFLKAIMIAQKSGKSDLAINILKGLLVHYEETTSDFLYGYRKCQSALQEARSILGEDSFQKAGFDDKLRKYESLL